MARCTVHAASDGLFRVWDEDGRNWTAGPFGTFEAADDARVACEGRRRRRAPVVTPSALQLAAPIDRVPRARQGKAGQDPSVPFVQAFSDGSWRAWNPAAQAFMRPWPTREEAMLQAQQIGRAVQHAAPVASQGSLFGTSTGPASAQRSLFGNPGLPRSKAGRFRPGRDCNPGPGARRPATGCACAKEAPRFARRIRDLERSVTALSETMHTIARAGMKRRALPAPRRR